MGVPQLPGVPPLAAYSAVPALAATLLTADAPGLFVGSLLGPQWGIFLDGSLAVTYQNVLSFTYKIEWAVADYPIEEGAFESYDKVQIPFDVRIKFTGFQEMLDTIAVVAADNMNLYTAVTPKAVYPNVTVTHYDYSQTATNGVNLVTLEVWLLNIQVAAGTQFQDTADPSGASPQNDGTVQATTTPGGNAGNVGPPTAANANQPGFVGGQAGNTGVSGGGIGMQ